MFPDRCIEPRAKTTVSRHEGCCAGLHTHGSGKLRLNFSVPARRFPVEERRRHVVDHGTAIPRHVRADGPCIPSRVQRRSLQGRSGPHQRRTRSLEHDVGTATPPDLELEESTSGEHEEGPLKERGNQVTYPSTCALRTLAGGLVADQCRLAGKRNASNWLLLWGQEPLLQVPWGARTIFQVMFFWLLAFWLLGRWVLPLTLQVLGLEQQDLSSRASAVLVLLLDVGELAATLGVLWVTLRKYRPLPKGWFRTYLWPATWWISHVALGVALFPLVDLAAARSQVWFPCDSEAWGGGLVEHSIINGDAVTKALYFIVVTACAPLWEESLFRGFLLPSLSKFIPISLSVLLSSFIFAAAHFSIRHFLPLMLLGIILGTLHVRTRNLMPCISLHSLWNAYIFIQLTRRASGTA